LHTGEHNVEAEKNTARALVCAVCVAALFGCGSSANSGGNAADAAEGGSLVEAGALGDDGSDGATGIINGSGGGPPVCVGGGCCGNETPDTPCDTVDAGTQCPSATTCAGGLILPTTLTCVAGRWTVASGVCGPDGGVADNGCPNSQPANGAPCALPDGGHCQYGLMCSGVCDAGMPPEASVADGSATAGTGCVSVSGRVGPAICNGGTWQTTPLGTCP
jgi:hypothetical protein